MVIMIVTMVMSMMRSMVGILQYDCDNGQPHDVLHGMIIKIIMAVMMTISAMCYVVKIITGKIVLMSAPVMCSIVSVRFLMSTHEVSFLHWNNH
jgi:hypothetical protein